jgi:pyruvate ferredoxin oxidoreductase gamma subunit
MKTASRIVGTAAFRQGYSAQDSPIYGAERRGAPMVAFTRFDSKPVLERGLVVSPDLVVIADESLIDDPFVRPLSGLSPNGTTLINSTGTADALRDGHRIPGTVACSDFTALALAHTGSTAALSVAIGAATAKMAGIEESFIELAVKEELEALGVAPRQLQKNLELAKAVCPVSQAKRSAAGNSSVSSPVFAVVTPVYRGGWRGTPSVAATRNTPLRKTGDWRVMRPVIHLDRCTGCSICFAGCPDGAIAWSAENLPQVDYSVCKGCMLCAEECPLHVIESVRETAGGVR